MYGTTLDSPLGPIPIASDGERLAGLWLAGQKYFAATVREPLEERPDLPIFSRVRAWLNAYFAGKRPAIAELPLAPAGSDFRKAVWDILCAIPYGHCTTYGTIARQMALRLGKTRMSAQAIGNAVGHNPISVIIPCHRVVGANGNLTGYAGGLDKKVWLLSREGVDMSRLSMPRTG